MTERSGNSREKSVIVHRRTGRKHTAQLVLLVLLMSAETGLDDSSDLMSQQTAGLSSPHTSNTSSLPFLATSTALQQSVYTPFFSSFCRPQSGTCLAFLHGLEPFLRDLVLKVWHIRKGSATLGSSFIMGAD
ncbi:hypothetical protein Ddc_07668 [Ditylenchus destructor]|nr:hypothetical protein Ddc_07668 [Ditylenchus destructor]